VLLLLIRLAVNLGALWLAAELLDGVTYDDDFGVLFLAAVVFTIVNWIVKPIVTILAIPVIILTLGIALFFVNMLMLLIVDWLVRDFDIEGFWTFVGATVIVWIVNLVISAAQRDAAVARERRRQTQRFY
jgi:putative membrane protein